MAMKWLTGEERVNSYLLRVHLDESRVNEEGKPLPGTVFEAEWSKDQDLEVSKTEHWRLAEHHLAQMQSKPLVME